MNTLDLSNAIDAAAALERRKIATMPEGSTGVLWSQSNYSKRWLLERSYGARFVANDNQFWAWIERQNENPAERNQGFFPLGIDPNQ